MRFLTRFISIGRKNWKDFEKILNLTPENGIHTKSRVQKQSWQTKHFTNSKLLSRNVFKNRHTLKALSKFINIHKLPLKFIPIVKWGFNEVSFPYRSSQIAHEPPLGWYALRNFPKFFGPKFSQITTLHSPWKFWIYHFEGISSVFSENVKIHTNYYLLLCRNRRFEIEN